MAERAPTVYIRLRKRVKMDRGQPILLKHVAQIIADPPWEEAIRNLELARPRQKDGSYVLIDMMLIVGKLKRLIPRVTIEHFGEPHTIVELRTGTRPAGFLLLALVWILLFVGSGMAIMNFHADVSMSRVHMRLYEMITGIRDEHPLVLQIPYSLGIGAGMILFFNRLFRKKFNEEPTPMEVEMFMYEESVHQFVVTDEYEKMLERAERQDRQGEREDRREGREDRRKEREEP